MQRRYKTQLWRLPRRIARRGAPTMYERHRWQKAETASVAPVLPYIKSIATWNGLTWQPLAVTDNQFLDYLLRTPAK